MGMTRPFGESTWAHFDMGVYRRGLSLGADLQCLVQKLIGGAGGYSVHVFPGCSVRVAGGHSVHSTGRSGQSCGDKFNVICFSFRKTKKQKNSHDCFGPDTDMTFCKCLDTPTFKTLNL